MNVLAVGCERDSREKSEALQLLNETQRLQVDSFLEKSSPTVSLTPTYEVDFRKMPNLAKEIKDELAGCYIIGDKKNPNGVFFQAFTSGSYYVSIDGGGVPSYFDGYQNRKVIDHVYRIWR